MVDDLIREITEPEESSSAETQGLFIAGCPIGAEIDQTVSLLEELQQRREEVEGDEETIGVIGGSPGEKSTEESWGLWGISGSGDRAQP